jgi:hypothetical protein
VICRFLPRSVTRSVGRKPDISRLLRLVRLIG